MNKMRARNTSILEIFISLNRISARVSVLKHPVSPNLDRSQLLPKRNHSIFMSSKSFHHIKLQGIRARVVRLQEIIQMISTMNF